MTTMMLGRARAAVGDVGWRVLIVLAAVIHTATVLVAYQWYEGMTGVVAATLSAITPVIPEVYWSVKVASREGTFVDWYVLAVIAYPILCVLFSVGGALFYPRSAAG